MPVNGDGVIQAQRLEQLVRARAFTIRVDNPYLELVSEKARARQANVISMKNEVCIVHCYPYDHKFEIIISVKDNEAAISHVRCIP